MSRRIRAAIFDMDGLMLDTEPGYRIAWEQAAADCGYQIPDELYARLIGRSRIEGERELAAAFGPPFPEEAFHEACLSREAAMFHSMAQPKKPGLEALLDLLDSRGVVKAVATSTVRETAVPQLAAAGLLPRFAVLATGDEVENGKPAPDLFLLAARRLGVEPAECLVLEDAMAGVLAAHRAGMTVFMVPDLLQPTPEIAALADGVFKTLADVAAHLPLLFGSVPASQT